MSKQVTVLLSLLTCACDGAALPVPTSDAGSSADAGSDAGPCGGGPCAPERFAEAQPRPSGVATDGERVVWTNEGDDPETGTISVCPVAGCPATGPSVIYDELDAPRSPIVAGNRVAWVAISGTNATRTILTLSPYVRPIDGSDDSTLPFIWPSYGITSISLDDGRLYFSGDAILPNSTLIGFCPVDGCPAIDNFFLVATDLDGSSSVAAEADTVVFTEIGSGRILRVDGANAAPETLFEAELLATELEVDGGYVYWATALMLPPTPGVEVQNYIARGPIGGGPKEVLAEIGAIVELELRDEWVYFADADGTVARVARTGGAVETFGTDQRDVSGIAVSDEHLYWTRREEGTVFRARLPE